MNPIFCAIDTPELKTAEKICEAVREHVGGIKIGLEFFMALGTAGYKVIADKGFPIFLDLKLHDIPNTVAGALKSLLPLKPSFVTIHASGGAAMMRAAAASVEQAGDKRPKLLGVTVLTSLDGSDLGAVGQEGDTKRQVLRLAQLAKENGMDGCICSPEEISLLRSELGKDFILMVPGIRPSWVMTQDQKRVMTPTDAMNAGANYLVIGRPITQSDDPSKAAQTLANELKNI